MSAPGQKLCITVSKATPTSGARLVFSSSMVDQNEKQGSVCEGDANPYSAHQRDDDEAASVGDEDLEELHEKMVMVVADQHGNVAHYPGEEDNQPHAIAKVDKNNTEAPHSVLGSGIESFKYLYSMILLIFCVAVVLAGIFTNQTTATKDMNVPNFFACIIFCFLICWLAMMEGGQGALVGLQPVEKALYEGSHHRALKNTALAHKGDNMERFIVGRQFLVVLVVFGTNLIASPIPGARVLGLNDVMTEIFLSSGLAIILTTIMIGQLTAQVNATNCMLDFINNYFMLFTTYVSLAIEYSGLLHSVYLVQMFFSMMSGKPVESSEPPRNALQKVLFWVRVLISLGVLVFAFAVTLSALFNGQTTMWKGVPDWVSVIIFFVLMCIVGMMEGMQIALFAVVNLPDDELKMHHTAHKNCQLAFMGQNLQAFLIGRQIFVTCCMFVVARITTVSVNTEAGEETVLGVSSGIQGFFNTGLLGAVITTIVASLSWRVVASSFPIAFLSNPLIYFIIRLCLIVEKSGVCSASWILARYHKLIVNYQPDEVHLHGAEPDTAEPSTRRDKEIHRLVNVSKFIFSLTLLAFSVVVVSAGIFMEDTIATSGLGMPTYLAFWVFCFLIIWLGMLEGGQSALVGLRPVDKTRYAGTHRRTWLVTSLSHRGHNTERFIVGRQFLVVLIVFAINLMASTVKDTNVLGLPEAVNEIFLGTSISVMLVTVVIGQLTALVNAANCMLDFLNNYLMVFTTYVSLIIEMSGLLHSVYLVQMIFSKLTGKAIELNNTSWCSFQNFFFWIRVFMSFAMLGFAFVVTLSGFSNGYATMWEGAPEWASVVVFLVLLGFMGMMEGMQSALFAVVNLPEEELKRHRIAYANCELAFRDENLQAFLIGRQICVTCCMFVVARITAWSVDIEEAEGIAMGSSQAWQGFLRTGLLGAVVATIVASLIWRVIASSFPIAFLSNPLIYLLIRLCLVLEASGVCSAAWVLGRLNKLVVGYQPDEVYLEKAQRHTRAPVTRRDKDIDVTITVIKYFLSMALLVLSVCVVIAAIFTEQTKVAERISPYLAFFLMLFLVAWLAMMEGGQGCLVGLQPVDKSLYEETHPISLMCTKLAHKGNNMERFILGRQFLTVLVVFVINLCGSTIAGAHVLNLSDTMTEIFLASGVAMILMTIILGQLTAQVNAANCMLDFIDTFFMLFTTYVSLAIEASGLVHAVYLVQIFFSAITGKPIESNEPPRSCCQKLFFWARVFMSVCILTLAFVITISALFDQKTAMYDGVPPYVSLIIFILLTVFVGMMEGMQIALFAVVNLPEEELKLHPLASKICRLTFSGSNLQAFLIGRQICVTICMFFIARITTASVDVAAGESTVLGVGNGMQEFFNTGLPGAVITTIVASLSWRIIASSFPVAFLSNPLIYLILRLCLFLEASGVCSAAWLLALIQKQVCGYNLDEMYIGTPEERAAQAGGETDEPELTEEGA